MELDREFVEYVAKALVTNPDAVQVTRSVDDMGVLLELTVDPADMGKIIGRAGATAKSLRTLLRVLGAKNDERVNLKIVEPDGGEVKVPEGDEPGEDVHPQPEPEPEQEPEPETSRVVEETRAELKEFDDLDI